MDVFELAVTGAGVGRDEHAAPYAVPALTIISTCQYVRKLLRVLPLRPRPSGGGCYSSTPPKQLNKLVRTELELTKRVVQGRFVQCVARVRLVKGDQVWAARGVKELPHRPPDATSADDSRGHEEGRRNASTQAAWEIRTFLELR